ncbi:hypothetical protein AB0F91_06870 [Amycolatopsis sp. NPDC023774]|uniref:hypothetical protein n=1 Tax=Amycolatopsis sp. NPDC023774 TaxID=3155015 RepID=UPI0033D7BD25
MRWTAYAAAAVGSTTLFDPACALATTDSHGSGPVNLELVTLAEDRAVITWYTGRAGTDDGLVSGVGAGRVVRSSGYSHAGDAVVEEAGPDRCRLELGSCSWVSLAAAFGRFDADLEVVGPPELAAGFEVLARRFERRGHAAADGPLASA